MDIPEDGQSPSEQAPINEEALLHLLGGDGAVHAPPTERPQDGVVMPPPPRSHCVNTRPVSLVSRPASRLSLSLPVQVAGGDFCEPQDATTASSESPTRRASPSVEVAPIVSPGVSSSFLVLLAAQERRVFELKEELHCAEEKLKKLKRQWALHEANPTTGRLRPETERMEMLQMYAIAANDDSNSGERKRGNIVGRIAEQERGRTNLAEQPKDCRRKVITGGHTRALSLLSPIQPSHDKDLTPLLDQKIQHTFADNRIRRVDQTLKRASSNRARHSYQDGAAIGVKQIAEDIKSGLWTFMEDLRQATVGDEAIKGSSTSTGEKTHSVSHRRASRRSLVVSVQDPIKRDCARNLSKSDPVDGEQPGNNHTAPVLRMTGSEKNLECPSSVDDDWSNWDSPMSKGESACWSDCTAQSSQDARHIASSLTDPNNIQAITKIESKIRRDEATWSPFNNFTPTSIKRTASAIIKEWERTLTPSIERRNAPISGQPILESKILEDGESKLLLNNLP